VAPAGVHVPLPEQTGAGWKVPPVHDGEPQDIPGGPCVQPLEPLQVPVLPQGGLVVHWPAGAGVPAASGVHVPGMLPLQVWQVPHTLPQQTPLIQLPLLHWFAAPHDAPFACLETQLPGVLALPVQ